MRRLRLSAQHSARSSRCADPINFGSQPVSEARDGHGGTPLHKAAGTANKSGVRELIWLGANVNAKNDRGQCPVDMVAECNADLRKEFWCGE